MSRTVKVAQKPLLKVSETDRKETEKGRKEAETDRMRDNDAQRNRPNLTIMDETDRKDTN